MERNKKKKGKEENEKGKMRRSVKNKKGWGERKG